MAALLCLPGLAAPDSAPGSTTLYPGDVFSKWHEPQALRMTAAPGEPTEIFQPLKFTASPMVLPNQYFGANVATDGTLVVVGAPGDIVPDTTTTGGVVYVMDENGAVLDSIVAPDPEAETFFGGSVAITKDYIAVGCPYDNLGLSSGDFLGNLSALGNASDLLEYVGSVYIYNIHRFPDGSFNTTSYRNKLFPYGEQMTSDSLFGALPLPRLQNLIGSDFATVFCAGWNLALSCDLLVVGSPGENQQAGSAYIFEVSTGLQKRRLAAPDGLSVGDRRDYFYGFSVATDGNDIVVGAPGDSDNEPIYVSQLECKHTSNRRPGTGELLGSDGASDTGDWDVSYMVQGRGLCQTTVRAGAPTCDLNARALSQILCAHCPHR